jgi:drug/metabolite transporter (DMT)-like permease
LLGLIWSTFAIFTKISAEALPPFFVAFSRLAIGSLLLISVILFQRKKFLFAKNYKFYFTVGFFNSALPFTLFALAARNLDSGIVAILDGTVPMFEVLISVLILRRKADLNAVIGVLLGMAGVVVTSCGNGLNLDLTPIRLISILAIMGACISYAGASLYINSHCKNIESMTLACGSVTCAAILLLPSIFFVDLSVIDARVGWSLFGLGFLCTGIAYIFYFKLAAEESPRTVVSVVLLIPVFGTIIGAVFADEVITNNKAIGCLMILASMKFILNLSRKNFFKSREPHAL